MAASVVAVLSLAAVLNNGRHSLALRGELEASVRVRDALGTLANVVNSELNEHLEHGLLSG